MKIVSVPRINALGLKGPEDMSKMVLDELRKNVPELDIDDIDVDNSNVEESEEIIYLRSKNIFKKYEKSVFIGGDHSITYPIFKAFSNINKNSFLVIFDAHADCMLPMKEPTHEEFLRAIIEEELVPFENIILVGVRKFEEIERKFLINRGIKVFEEIFDLELVADYITEKANGKDVYVSIDIDVLDPAFASAVNYPEPNGLSSKELFYLLKRIFCIKSLKALDIVEVVPGKDKKYDYRTVKIASKIAEEFVKSSH